MTGCPDKYLCFLEAHLQDQALSQDPHGSTPRARSPKGPEMSDEHAKGPATGVKGKVEETAGKVTGNQQQELHGKATQGQGEAQKGLGDAEDALRPDRN
jgi:uncharacterized protein YjbJ (UPF0337 family)